MKQKERKEDAISPVIGVMLMLVVTVVIAAVIAGFATGMAGDSTATTPMALLEADNSQLHPSVTDWMTGKHVLNTFDIVHKGGDPMVLENIQVSIEPFGGGQYGIIVIREGAKENHLEVVGKESLESKATVSTGDRIRVHVLDPNNPYNSLEHMAPGVTVKWTVSDVRTTGIIAKGEFVVPEA